jgi:hypothetical protein
LDSNSRRQDPPDDFAAGRALRAVGEYISPDDDPSRLHLLVCPNCHQESDRIRSYTLFIPFFALVIVGWQFVSYLVCPRCMRRNIFARLPLAILMANILCPIVLVWWAVVFLQTFFRSDE